MMNETPLQGNLQRYYCEKSITHSEIWQKGRLSIWFCMSQSDFASSKFSSCSLNKKITNQENIVNLILHQNNLQTLSTNIKLPLIKVTGINTFNKTLSGLTRLVLQPMLNIYLTFNFLSILPPVSFKLELETRTVCSQHHILLYPYKKIQKLSVSPVITITQQNYIHLWLSDIITYGGNHMWCLNQMKSCFVVFLATYTSLLHKFKFNKFKWLSCFR
jgi:hypothetical protein